MYIDKMLKQFNMKEFKRWYLPVSHEICLSKYMCSKTQIERYKMKIIPYASAIRSIMYAILYTRSYIYIYNALSITSRYQFNPGEGH
jgi:hypothetical protein